MLQKAVTISKRNPWAVASLGYACGFCGRNAEAEQLLNELLERSSHEYVSSVFLAFVHAALKERDDGIRCLEQACRTRDAWMTTILVEPAFDALRPHPRFGALVKQVLGTSEVG